jgi:hypothetical protein
MEILKEIKFFYKVAKCKDPCSLCIVKAMCNQLCTNKIYEIGMKNTLREKKNKATLKVKSIISSIMSPEFWLDTVFMSILWGVMGVCIIGNIYCLAAMICLVFDIYLPTPIDITEFVRSLYF